MNDEPNGRGRRTAIGAFVLGGVVLALGAIVLFGRIHLFSPTLRVSVVFQDSISGLSVGAPVSFHGVRIGDVNSIAVEFDPKTQAAYIPVTLEMEPKRVILTSKNGSDAPDLPHLITRGLRAELNTQSFVTGQSEIDLDFDPTSPVSLHPDITTLPEIPTRQSAMQKVKEQLTQLPLRALVDNANATLRSLQALSETLDREVPPLIESLRATSDRSGKAVDLASTVLINTKGRLDGALESIDRLANSGTLLLSQRGADLRTLLVSSNQTFQQARDLLADLKGLTSERGADRTNIDASLRDIAASTAALRGLANDVEHNPQLLLTGRRP